MTTTLRSAESVTSLTANYRNNVDGPNKPQWAMNHTIRRTYTHGTGAGQATTPLYAKRTVAVAVDGDTPTVDVLDLSGTALKDVYGNNVALTEIHEIIIENTGGVELLVGGGTDGAGAAAALLWGPDNAAVIIPLAPGDHIKRTFRSAGGLGVVAATSDALAVTNVDEETAGAYTISILGN